MQGRVVGGVRSLSLPKRSLAWVIFKSGNGKCSTSCPSVDADCRQRFPHLTIGEMEKKRQACSLRGFCFLLVFFFFFNLSFFRSNLHIRGKGNCSLLSPLNLRTAGDIFHDSLNSHHSKEIFPSIYLSSAVGALGWRGG